MHTASVPPSPTETLAHDAPTRAAHSGRGLQSILARLKHSRAQAPAPFRESDFLHDTQTPEWSVLGKL